MSQSRSVSHERRLLGHRFETSFTRELQPIRNHVSCTVLDVTILIFRVVGHHDPCCLSTKELSGSTARRI